MPSGYTITGGPLDGSDLDDLFLARGAEPAGPNVGYQVAGVDLAQRYFPSSGVGDRIADDTNYLSGGADLRTKFRDIAFVSVPVFTLNPVTQSVREGSTVNFTVLATGSPTYQWRKGGVDLPGETSTTLTLTGVDDSDEGSYDCVATSTGGSATSSAASLTVVMDPAITSGPGGPYTLDVTNVASFSITATGDSLSYQWRKDGVDIPGANSNGYIFTTTSPSDSGDYDCVVTNPYDSVTSPAANLTVNDIPPSITGGTVTGGPYILVAGDVANFTVTATGTNLAYAWTKNGSPLGSTGANHTFVTTGPGDDGTYGVVVSNSAGSDSDSADLTVV